MRFILYYGICIYPDVGIGMHDQINLITPNNF